MSHRATSGFHHDLLVYNHDDDQFAVSVPFIREGIERGETVLINTGSALRDPFDAMFSGEPLVTAGPEVAHASPAQAMGYYDRLLRRESCRGQQGVRAVELIDFAGVAGSWREWIRYESVINAVFAPYRLHRLCLYDERSVSGEILDGARRAHPTLAAGSTTRVNERYLEAGDLLAHDDFRIEPDPLESTRPTVELHDVEDLASMRTDLHLAMMHSVLPAGRIADLVSAVNEIVTNAFRHGAPPVSVLTWCAPDRVVCTITDRGEGIADPLAGFDRPARDGASVNLGLWAARQLCDLLDYRSTEHGFTVRLVARSPADGSV